jgi:hypothetical protein
MYIKTVMPYESNKYLLEQDGSDVIDSFPSFHWYLELGLHIIAKVFLVVTE